MEEASALEKFLEQYNENEREIVSDSLGNVTPKVIELIEKVLLGENLENLNEDILPKRASFPGDKEKIWGSSENIKKYVRALNKSLLSEITKNIEQLDPLTNFLILTCDEPKEKREEILKKIGNIADITQRAIILNTIVDILRSGNVPLENIHLDCCNEKNGIVLNTQLDNGKWLAAIDAAKNDGMSPFGHWITYLSDDKVTEDSFEKASKFIRNNGGRLQHDATSLELGMEASNNRVDAHLISRLVSNKMEEFNGRGNGLEK